MPQADSRLEAMMSKQEIKDVLARYARGVDRADEEMLKSCYHPDAIEEHGSAYAGPAHEYIEGAVVRIRQMGTMCHYICNVHIELEEELAYVEAYVLTFARFSREEESFDTLTGGRICDRFERRAGECSIRLTRRWSWAARTGTTCPICVFSVGRGRAGDSNITCQAGWVLVTFTTRLTYSMQ